MTNNRLEVISRIAIFLPLILVVLLVLSQSKKPNQSSIPLNQTISSSPQQSQSSKTNISVNKENISLDLKGPYRCIYKKDTIEADISIKNRNIAATMAQNNQISNIVVKGDCLYRWNQNSNKGEKMCSIEQYLSIIDMLSSTNLLNIDSIFSMVNTMRPGVSIAPSSISNIADSCKKVEVDEKLFTVPSNITFTEMESISPSPVTN